MDRKHKTEASDVGIRRHSCVIGIDPGLDGGVAVYDPIREKIVTAWKMPTTTFKKGRTKSRSIDLATLATAIADACVEYGVQMIVIEKVSSSPQMGVASAFNFGKTFGITLAICELYCNDVQYVSPQKWKARMLVSSDKKKTVERAQSLFGASPWFLKTSNDGPAEAALLAAYAAKDLITDEVDPLS